MKEFQHDFKQILQQSQDVRNIVDNIELNYIDNPILNEGQLRAGFAWILLRESFLLNYIVYLANASEPVKVSFILDMHAEFQLDEVTHEKEDRFIAYASENQIAVNIGKDTYQTAYSSVIFSKSSTISEYMIEYIDSLDNKKLEDIQPASHRLSKEFVSTEEGKTLSQNLRARLLDNEFIKEKVKRQSFNSEDANKILETLKENAKRDLEKDLEQKQSVYRDLMDEIQSVIKQMDDIRAKMSYIDVKDSSKRLERVLRDKRIEKIHIIDQVLIIKTKPLKLSYDENKINSIERLKKLQEGSALYIGRHEIRINFRTLDHRSKPLDGFRNLHIQRYNCYGNFSTPISEAKEQNQLDRLISLLLQALQHVTIGDPAGRDTVNEAYIVNKDNAVMHKNKLTGHLKFLELINGNTDELDEYLRNANRNRDNDDDGVVEEVDQEASIDPF